MSNKNSPDDARYDALKNEAARQRWQLFHRAIAHAKQSNYQALDEADKAADRNGGEGQAARPEPRLSIAR